MRNTEKDKYWREMIRKQGELRHFGSMAIRKSSKGDLASAQAVSYTHLTLPTIATV